MFSFIFRRGSEMSACGGRAFGEIHHRFWVIKAANRLIGHPVKPSLESVIKLAKNVFVS
jgi:hypothetical protein